MAAPPSFLWLSLQFLNLVLLGGAFWLLGSALRWGCISLWLAAVTTLALGWAVWRGFQNYMMFDDLNDAQFNRAEDALAQGASPNARSPGSGEPAIVTAARYPQSGFLETLLQRGADPRPLLDGQGKTILEEAVRQGYGYAGLDQVLHEAAEPRNVARWLGLRILEAVHLLLVFLVWIHWRDSPGDEADGVRR